MNLMQIFRRFFHGSQESTVSEETRYHEDPHDAQQRREAEIRLKRLLSQIEAKRREH